MLEEVLFQEQKNLWMIPEIYFTKNMEQVVMQKLTRALKIKPIFIFILLTAGICFSQTDSFPEDSIAAKFCFNADTSREDTQTVESVWKLSVYEQVIPLTVTIQTESYDFMPIISAELISNIRHRLSGIVLEGSRQVSGKMSAWVVK